jgi:plasmid stability protein
VTLGDIYDLRLPEWGLEERLTIGESTGAPEYELFRVTDATVLQDGSIAVANRGTAEVRVYGPDGRYVRSFGREGQGPGEFERLSWVARADGDVLVTFDADLRRVTWFASTGEVLRTLTIDPEAATPANATRFGTTSVEAVGSARGRLLVRAGYLRRSGEGEFRDMFTLALADERGALADTLGQYSGQELYFHAAPSGLTLATPPIFGHDTHIGAAADRLVAGSSERFALDVYDGSVLQMKIVATVDVAPATQTEVEAWLQSRRERASEGSGPGGELARLSIEAAPVRQTPPAFQRLAVDSERSIWVEEPYRVPHGTSRWVVLSADGTPSARVELPMSGPTTPRTAPDLTILEIGEGYILGLRRDEHEIEQVVLYRLERRP